MDCIVAASTGALKGINLRDNSFTNLLPIKTLVPKQDEITSMIWSGSGQSEVLAALLDRQLKLYDASTSTFNSLYRIDGGEGAVQGLHSIEGGKKVVSCVESGHLNVWDESGESTADWEAGPGVKVMRGCNTRKEVVTGGLKNLMKTWDIETGKSVWSARNVGNIFLLAFGRKRKSIFVNFKVPLDFLGLEVPIACTDARYIDDSGTIIEATKVHELRLYDPRAQRRPVKKIPFMDVPITAVSRCYKDNHVLAANSIGEMGLFDLRSKVHPVCKYKGQAGAIRSIDAHPSAPYVATCGIDRFVRVHDIDTRKLAHKIVLIPIMQLAQLNNVVEGNCIEASSWMELKKEINCDSDSASASGSDDDESVDECNWEKLGVSDDDDPMNNGTLRKRRDEEAASIENESCGDEPASKKRRVTKSKKRREEPEAARGGFRRRASETQKGSKASGVCFVIDKSVVIVLLFALPSHCQMAPFGEIGCIAGILCFLLSGQGMAFI
ncbi:WD domain, G-beta repeat protein [Cooperia oncophora]